MTHFAQSVSSLAGLFFGDDEDRAEVHEWQGGRNPARSTMPVRELLFSLSTLAAVQFLLSGTHST